MEPGKRSLTHETIGGVFWMAAGRGGGMLLQVIVLAVLARLLTPADFGVVGAALVLTGFSAVFSQLGMGPALVQRKDLQARHTETAFVASVALGLLLGGVIWLAAPLAAGFFKSDLVRPVLRWLTILFPLQGLGLVSEAAAKRQLSFRWLAKLDVVAYAVGYGAVGSLLALAGWGVWALVTAELTKGATRTAMLLLRKPPPRRPRAEVAAFRDLFYFGSGFTVGRIFNYLALQGDYLVVGRVLGPAALGLYTRAYQLMATPASGLGNILDQVLFPAMARVQSNPVRLARAYRASIAILAAIMMPMSLVLLLLAPELVAVILGPGWSEVVVPLQLLAVGTVFRTTYKMSDSVTRATGAVYRRAWRQAVYAGMVIAGAWVGGHWGLAGVALGVVVALGVNFGLMAHLSIEVLDMRWSDFWSAFTPAIRLTAACLPALALSLIALRHWFRSPVLVLTGTLTVCAFWAMLVSRFALRRIVGDEIAAVFGSVRDMLVDGGRMIRTVPRPLRAMTKV